LIGAVVGNYRITQQLGTGGMGVVYLGQHSLLGRHAAIKVLRPELSTHPEIVSRFFNEARAVTAINDPGIVQVFDFGHHTDGSAFIVMELLDGEPMDRRLQRIGRFEPGDCVRFMRLICTSLAAAHASGIVHRDLKPENIFLVRDPGVPGGERAKLLDFGIAKLSSDPGVHRTRTGAFLGTPIYMSPEQCHDAGEVDHRSDIYSMGCVMFTMLTGRPPFDGLKLGLLIVAHLREAPPLAASRVPAIPDVVEQIVQRCLQKSPADRFASMTELAQALAVAEQILNAGIMVPPAPDPALSGDRSTSPPAPLSIEHTPPAIGRPQPTTLGVATGESLSRASRRAPRWIAAVLTGLGALALALAVVLIAQRSEDGSSPLEAGRRSATAAAGAPAGPTVVDAAVWDATDFAAAIEDAGVPDPAAVDAAQPQPPKQGSKGLPTLPRRGHANSTKPPLVPPPVIDRGD
jgi:serine/threonine-protein kinase